MNGANMSHANELQDANSGSGGGIFGWIIKRVNTDPQLNQKVRGKIRAGNIKEKGLPYIILSHVTSNVFATFSVDDTLPDVEGVGRDRIDYFDTQIQVSVYNEGYERTRLLGKMVHRRISRQMANVDGICCKLIPATFAMIPDPVRSEKGQYVWQAVWRYRFYQPEVIEPLAE